VRLLLDEQLSDALCGLLADDFPDSQHIRLLGFEGASDETVWELAKTHDCILVTKAEDFQRLSVPRGAPPKVLWIRLGNSPTAGVAELLRRHIGDIRDFVHHEESAFLTLG